MALDLGGTNFRVILLELVNGVAVREDVKKYHIRAELRTGSGIPLFDYLAECVSDFVITEGLQNVELPLGKLKSISLMKPTAAILMNILLLLFPETLHMSRKSN